MPAALSWLVVLLVIQGSAPLRKSDLVRLVSGSAMSPVELARLVRRNCLTFEPTPRDRTDFQRLGAERSLLAAMDACARRASASRRTPVSPATGGRFVSGGGQRGSAGVPLPRAVVFEAKDSAGRPLAGETVMFTGINARIEPASAATDTAGLARARVILGERVGSATVIAAIGIVEKQVAFNVVAGPAQQLVVFCGQSSVAGRFAIRRNAVVVLRVFAQDAFSNPTALIGLRAAVADTRIFPVVRVAQDSIFGTVELKPEQPGTTSLAVIANGMRQYLTVTVPARAAPGRMDCR